MVPDRVFLVGFVGARIDQIGRALAERLERPLFELDKLVEQSARMPLGDLYRKEGESGFRHRERRSLVGVATGPPSVIVTGPGTFIDRGNRRTIEQAGISVYIDATLEACLTEAVDSGILRPSEESNERFTTQFEARRPEYEKADVLIDPMDRDPDTIADDLLQRLEDRVWAERLA